MAERRQWAKAPAERQQGAKAPADGELTAAEAGRSGLRHITELTGHQPEGVTGVEPVDDGWLVTVELLEDRRIPSSSDLLSTYEAEMTPDGELLAYRRLRRYTRGKGEAHKEQDRS